MTTSQPEDARMLESTPNENPTPAFNAVITDEISITPVARQQIKSLVDDEEDVEGVRIYVAGGGCSGMTYSMTFAAEQYGHDCVLEQDGLKIFVDAVALHYLEGVEIDYQSNETGASFVFKNVFQAVGGAGMCAGCGAAGNGGY
ncbi:MAG: iron-sulfur cluster assembly accessory protein [Gammaproteobacteria bacterium]|nr:iron-sulfur cluster assembly accessory protein [Gammaproteobacteria bacterium]